MTDLTLGADWRFLAVIAKKMANAAMATLATTAANLDLNRGTPQGDVAWSAFWSEHGPALTAFVADATASAAIEAEVNGLIIQTKQASAGVAVELERRIDALERLVEIPVSKIAATAQTVATHEKTIADNKKALTDLATVSDEHDIAMRALEAAREELAIKQGELTLRLAENEGHVANIEVDVNEALAAGQAAMTAAHIAGQDAAGAQASANAAQETANGAQSAANTAKGAADDAAANAALAAGIAGGKADVLIQSTAPTTDMRKATTLWIDTTGNANTPKRWNGSAWVAVESGLAVSAAAGAVAADAKAAAAQNAADNAATAASQARLAAAAAQLAADGAQMTADEAGAAAAAASTAANKAQTSADGKNAVWYQNDAPTGTGHKVGDTWFDTNDGNKIYRWSGSAWVAAQLGTGAIANGAVTATQIASAVNTAISDAANAASAADAKAQGAQTAASTAQSAANSARSVADMAAYATLCAERDPARKHSWLRAMYPHPGATISRAPTYLDLLTLAPATEYIGDVTEFINNVGDQYVMLARAVFYVASTQTITTSIAHDDGTAVCLDGSVIYTNNGVVSSGGTLSFTATAGWHVLDILLNENTGNDYVRLGAKLSTLVDDYYAPVSLQSRAADAEAALADAHAAATAAATAQTTANNAATAAAAAATAAGKAQTSADGKNAVWYQTTAPAGTAHKVGDTWFDTDDGNRVYRWSGSAWTAAQFGPNAIANAAITNAQIADATIQNAKIATLDAAKITTGTLSADRIAANAITTAKIATNAVTANEIAANTITAASGVIANAAITNAMIADATIQNAKIANLDAAKITTGTINADRIGAGTIGATHIAAGAIAAGTAIIGNGAISNAMIANATIEAAKIKDATITAAKIATINADTITTGTLSAARIASKSITADKVTISAGESVMEDGTFARPGDYWGADSAPWSFVTGLTTASSPPRPYSLGPATALSVTASGSSVTRTATRWVATDGTASYRLSGWVYSTVAQPAGWFYGGINRATATSNSTAYVASNATGNEALVAGVWTYVTFPAQAMGSYHSIRPVLGVRNTASAGTIYFSDWKLVRATDASLIVDGAITADKIAANAITAAKIEAGAITAAKIAADAIDGKIITGATLQSSTDEAGTNYGCRITGGKVSVWAKSFSRTVEISDGRITFSGSARPGEINVLSEYGIMFNADALSSTESFQYGINSFGARAVKFTMKGQAVIGQIAGPGSGLYVNAFGDADNKVSIGILRVNNDTSGVGQFIATNAYSRTTTGVANLNVGTTGIICRSSSLRKDKAAIENVGAEAIGGILDVPVRTWFDRGDHDRYAHALDKLANGEEVDWDNVGASNIGRRTPGVVAEEVEAAGLEQFCTYDDEGNLTGVMYDRLALLLIPTVRELRDRVEALEAK